MLVDLYRSFKSAENEIRDRIFSIEAEWFRTQKQVEFLQRIGHKLESDILDMQDSILQRLVPKLQEANTQVGRLKKRKEKAEKKNPASSEFKRLKYAWLKETTGSLDKAIHDLQAWQRLYDPSWYLLMRVADPVIDKELAYSDQRVGESKTPGSRTIEAAKGLRRTITDSKTIQKTVFRPADSITGAQRGEIAHSSATLLQRSPDKWYILDSVPYLTDMNEEHVEQDIRNFAGRLSNTDTKAFGLLQCAGVIRQKDSTKNTITSYDFIFYLPPGLREPQSLRSVLLSADPNVSLTTRFRIAKQLAQSVSYVHTYGFVHKSIRPDTLLIFANNEGSLSSSFLVGFERFRLAEAQRTLLKGGDTNLEKQLYRHPQRQGLQPAAAYVMQHDIYSLGVCMLEIGLWQSFVVLHSSGILVPSPLLSLSEHKNAENITGDIMKDYLISLAEKELPKRMGDRYTAVVVSCLTCLDELNPDFSDIPIIDAENGVPQAYDSDMEISIGIRYIEKACRHKTYIAFANIYRFC